LRRPSKVHPPNCAERPPQIRRVTSQQFDRVTEPPCLTHPSTWAPFGSCQLENPQAFREHPPLDQLKQALRQQPQGRRRYRTLQDQADVVKPNTGQDRLPVAACADQCTQGSRAHVDDCRSLDASEDGAGGQRQLYDTQPCVRRQAQGLGRFDDGVGDVSEPGIGTCSVLDADDARDMLAWDNRGGRSTPRRDGRPCGTTDLIPFRTGTR
jgi:hypothetical protein